MEMIDFVKEKVVNNENSKVDMENLYYNLVNEFAREFLKESSLVNGVCHYLIGGRLESLYTLQLNETFGKYTEGWGEFTVWNHAFGDFNGNDILFFANGEMRLLADIDLLQYYKKTHSPEDTCKKTLENWGFFDEVYI